MLGLLQVMVYAGAVMVLVVVTIMASGGAADAEPRLAEFSFPRWAAVLGLGAAALEVALTFVGRGETFTLTVASSGLASDFGRTLFTSYALATEAVTLLMFLAALAVAPDKEVS